MALKINQNRNCNEYFVFITSLLGIIANLYIFYQANCEGEACSIAYFSIYVLVFFLSYDGRMERPNVAGKSVN